MGGVTKGDGAPDSAVGKFHDNGTTTDVDFPVTKVWDMPNANNEVAWIEEWDDGRYVIAGTANTADTDEQSEIAGRINGEWQTLFTSTANGINGNWPRVWIHTTNHPERQNKMYVGGGAGSTIKGSVKLDMNQFPMNLNDTTSWTWTNFTWENHTVKSKNVGWRIGYNDTAGDINYTSTKTFKVTISFASAPNVTLSSPTNHATKTPPVNFTANLTFFRNPIKTELWLNKTDNITKTWVTDTDTEWDKGTFTNTVSNNGLELNMMGSSESYGEDGTIGWVEGPSFTAGSISNETTTVANGTVSLFHDGDSNSAFFHDVTNISSSGYAVSVWLQDPDSADSELFTLTQGQIHDGANQTGFISFNSSDYIEWYNGNFNGLTTYTPGEWVHMVFKDFNFSAHTLDIYINGVKEADDIGFRNDLGWFDNVEILASAATEDWYIDSLEWSNASYVTNGSYVSKNFDIGETVYPQSSNVTATIPSGTDYNITFGENSTGTWTYYSSVSSMPTTRFMRFNISMSGNGSNTPNINKVNISYDEEQEVWRLVKTNQSKLVNATVNGIEYNFSTYNLPQGFVVEYKRLISQTEK